METRTLLLNSWGWPHAILSWQDAICLAYQDKVMVMEEYDEIISSPSISYFIPAVAQLKHAVATMKKGVKFSRINIFTRDSFRCQYCGGRFTMRELNYDHVIPRKFGGQTAWENVVHMLLPLQREEGWQDTRASRYEASEEAGKASRAPPSCGLY